MSMKHIFYGGNGTTPVDSGLPLVGRFFTVDDDGGGAAPVLALHRERRAGPFGRQRLQRAAATTRRTRSGRGFASMLHMVGGGDGIMLAIPPSGDLTFFRYTGNGEADETGSMGFEGPHQATVIGNGFHTLPPRVRLAARGSRREDDPLRGERGRRPALVPLQR